MTSRVPTSEAKPERVPRNESPKRASSSAEKPRRPKSYKPDSSEFNSRLIGRFTPSATPKDTLAEREAALYEDYLAALKSGRIPHSDTLLKALGLLDRAALLRTPAAQKSSQDDHFKSIARCLLDRHVIMLFQDSLGTSEINARGELFSTGVLRTIEDKNGKPYRARMGGIVKLSTCVVDSYIATAALLAHEFWHIKEGELRPNKLKEPEAVELKGNDVFSGSENFADYLAGREVTYLGFTEQSIFSTAKFVKDWGPRWYDSESFSILIQKYRLYGEAWRALRAEAASRALLWNTLKATRHVTLHLGLTVSGTSTKNGKVEFEWHAASGIRKDGYRIQRPTPDFSTTSDKRALRWTGRRFTGNYAESAEHDIHVEGEIDARGRTLSSLVVRNVFSYPGFGRRELSVDLRNVPLARYATRDDKLMCFEIIGPAVRNHVNKLTWTWKTWDSPKPGAFPKIKSTSTLKRIIWDKLELIPYVQVVFYAEASPALGAIEGKFAVIDD